MKKLTALIVLLIVYVQGFAQDPHFSQFFASPLTLNPAYTGKFDGTFRAAGNYRNQWPTINNAFTTATASVDFGIIQKRLPEFDTWGVGIMGLNDQSGNKILSNNFISLSTAYHKALDENGYHTLTVGFQGTFANKRLDISKATFEDMLRADGFTGTTQEDFVSNTSNINLNYFDVNAGLLYSGSTDGYNNFYLGVSTYHINRPKESFTGGNYILNPRLTVHGGGYVPVGRITTLHASFIHQRQAGASETVAGAALSFKLNDDEDTETALYTGLWYRFKDAFIPYVGIEFAGVRIGYSYDVNNSSLNTASNSRGGNEISLIYIRKASDPNRKKLGCPKF
ncbi:MAG: PorP/SprF family type IX secretion system membrane protein [Chitinophagaceae bacterium]|nr:PorP/SprF family type IX secretion system membrane protein [Chitinophagaceae bacterium]